MARRRRIEAPTPEELARMAEDAGGAGTLGGFAAKPPIAQIAGEAAAMIDPEDDASQAERARNAADAETLRRARAEGWEVRELPLAAIRTDGMTRDRMAMDPEAMEEMRASLRANGLRMPVEVVADGDGFALVSGLRRLTAMRDVAGQEGTIRAFVRPAASEADRIVAMVEENEVRAGLSSYERGRAAVNAVESGAFASLEEAVDRIFASASKAKRSKVRSFAMIHEELGDLLQFPQALSERQGLRLAAALRAGFGQALRQALASGEGGDAGTEWAALERALEQAEAPEPKAPKGGRPKAARTATLPSGLVLRHVEDAGGHAIRLEGPGASKALAQAFILEIEGAFRRAAERVEKGG